MSPAASLHVTAVTTNTRLTPGVGADLTFVLLSSLIRVDIIANV